MSSQDTGAIGGFDRGAPSSIIFFVASSIATSITTSFATTFVVGISVGNFVDNASIDLEKVKTFVCFVVDSTNQGKAIIQLLELESSKLDFDLESNFWNDLFEKELKKYDDRLQAMHYRPLLETINVNKAIGHIFNHL